MTAAANDQKTGRAVAGEELFESLARFVVIHNGQSPARAERIADQAVAFLVTAATATVPMVPSDDVDLGLHALILHTNEYAVLCGQYAGRVLHHNPMPGGGTRDLEGVSASARAAVQRECEDGGRPFGAGPGRYAPAPPSAPKRQAQGGRRPRRQNSLPSGSARTTHD